MGSESISVLEAKIAALLVDCESLIEPVSASAQKWVAQDANTAQLVAVEDRGTSVTLAWARSAKRIEALPSYAAARDCFARDSVFTEARRLAGFWATFEAVIQSILLEAATVVSGRFKVDQAKAIAQLRKLRLTLGEDHLRFVARARVLGVISSESVIQLADDISFVQLKRDELAERQPILRAGVFSEGADPGLLREPTELRIPITVPVDRTLDSAFFHATNAAQQLASEMAAKAQQALLLTCNGNAFLGPIRLVGGLEGLPVGYSVQARPIMLGVASMSISREDAQRLPRAYDLVVGGKYADPTLSRALHRFLLGRQRSDLIDRLVDYVIAWEAILLTQEGNPLSQELSYRFSVNGAILLAAYAGRADKPLSYRKMLSAYRTRSAIVHGGTDSNRDKALEVGGYPNIQALCDFLEISFRDSIFALSRINSAERPYRQPNGWETLMWA